jgi:hypothetical protein
MPRPGWRSIVVALVFAVASRSAVLDAQTATPVPAALAAAEERAVLMAFYEATGGPGWKVRRGWGSDQSVCRWAGVRCGSPPADQQVVSLELPENRLRGTIPASLATLPWLHTLDLSRNPLRGAVPPTLIDRANQNLLDLRMGGTSLNEALTSVTIQIDAVTGMCHGDLNTHMVIDPRRREATIEAVRCHNDPKRESAIMCVRGTTRAPDLEMISRALRRLGVAYRSDQSSRPDQMMSDHEVTYETTFTWGDGEQVELSTVEPYGPLDVRIAQRLLLRLVPEPGDWKAREVDCKSLPWAEWVQD